MRASGESSANGHSPRRAHGFLLCGAIAGIALAATGVLRSSASRIPASAIAAHAAGQPKPLPADAIACVNDRVIRHEDFQQVLALEMAAGLIPSAAEKQRILDRMIDEELRIQRAIELKLHLSDPRVRMDLASAVAEAATSAVEKESADEVTLGAYFEKRRDYFARRGPLRVRQIWVGILAGNLGEAFNRARAATKLLRNRVPFETVREIVGTHEPRPIPDELLSPDQLASHLGRMALNTALTMQPGDISDPIRTTDGFHVLQVLERQPCRTVDFAFSRLDVEAEFWSECARRAMEANAAELRKNAVIRQAGAF